MFTGIIKRVGTITEIKKNGGVLLTIMTEESYKDMKKGTNTSIDGINVYVTSSSDTSFTVSFHPDTFANSALISKHIGDTVNIEPALRLGEQIEGMLVGGIVDGIGTVQKMQHVGEKLLITIQVEQDMMKYIAVRGSIIINGAELNVLTRKNDSFTCAIYRRTLLQTNFEYLKIHDQVNLEISSVARYIENLMDRSEFFTKRSYLE
jgi:riboflavin synthase